MKSNELTDKEHDLLIMFLRAYADELGNNSCNDFEFPESWSEEEILKFNQDNMEPYDADDEGRPLYPNADFCFVGGLVNKLKRIKNAKL